MTDKDAANKSTKSSSDALSARADKATILGAKITKKTLTWTIIGVAVAAIATYTTIVLSGNSDSGQSADVSGDGNNVNQNTNGTQNQATGTCGQVGNGNSCVVELQDLAKESPTDEEFKSHLEDLSTTPPPGKGPWAFVIVDTAEYGLFARSTNVSQGDRVGLGLNRELVWADCVATSDFLPPDPINDVGPQWLRVRWKNDETSTLHMFSDPSDAKRAWMYRGLTVPFGHNGDIPTC